MTELEIPVESVTRYVEQRTSAAAQALAAGDRAAACDLYRETIDHLLANRNSYVNLHRGVGTVLGGATGLLLAFLIPGGHTLSALGALFGYGYLGERLGRYAGERMTADEYLRALVELHRRLVDASPAEAPPIAYWKNLVVLETPFSIFAPILEGSSAGSSWTALKNLLGFDPFALALENASERFPSWKTMLEMARALLPVVPMPQEAGALARCLYMRKRGDRSVNHLLAKAYRGELDKGIDTLVYLHRQRFDEDLMELFSRDFAEFPESEVSVVNLSTLLARRGTMTLDAGNVYLARYRLDSEQLRFAAYAVRALPDLSGHQELLEAVLAGWDGLSLPREDRVRVLEARALHLAEQGDESDAALELYQRLLPEKHVVPVAFRMAHALLDRKTLDRLTRPIAGAAFDLRHRLEPAERTLLARFYRSEAVMDPSDAQALFSAAHLLMDSGEWSEAAQLLENFKVRAREPADRLDALELLARAYRSGGQHARAFEYYKGVGLVRPSRALCQEVFELAEELRREGQRPSLVRDLLTLVKTMDPSFVSAAGVSVLGLLKEYSSVFDYYLQETLEKVGGGGMAEVFRGVHAGTGEVHIIKKLRTDFGTREEMERFAALFGGEIRAIKRINSSDHAGSRHVITLHHESAEESHYCYSMEALDEVLAERIARDGAVSESETVELLRDITSGLAAAHAAGVIHRDLNPRNVGFRQGVLKIFDFGTAHILRTTLHLTRTPRSTDYILGTPCYMSPEQSVGDPFDERTDVFSLGCIGYELLTGELAFPGQVGSLVLLHDPACPERLRRRMTERARPALVDVILGALAAKPGDRPSTAEKFGRAIAEA